MTMVSPDDGRPSISRTTRYKKVTKPLLERKRRARINRCLDELKDLMVGAFEVEGDNISKLEKADILELTVRHLTKLHSPRDPSVDAERFQAGFGQCAAEACQFILAMPEVDRQIGQNLIKHLTAQIGEAPLPPPPSPEVVRTTPPQPSPPPPPKVRQIQTDRRETSPYVPLRCETSSTLANPAMVSSSEPGLLMTVVDEEVPPPHQQHRDEVKHVIMKRIREQILGRQTTTNVNNKDIDIVSSSTSSSNSYPGTSTDLRMKSKGEAKHFSPRSSDHHHHHHHHHRYDSYDNCENAAINYSMNKKSNQLSDYSMMPTSSSIERVPDQSHPVRKRQADYRNIHPKKALIRPPMDHEEIAPAYGPPPPPPPKTHSDVYYHNRYRPEAIPARVQNNSATCYRENARGGVREYQHYAYRPEPADEQEENMWRPW